MEILKAFIERALANNADGISIEYKDGYEEVCLLKGNLGLELDKIKSNSDQRDTWLAAKKMIWSLLVGFVRVPLLLVSIRRDTALNPDACRSHDQLGISLTTSNRGRSPNLPNTTRSYIPHVLARG